MPLLVILIMVKDEESVITNTLKPFVDAGINDFCVFDTGSTDSTVSVTRQLFRDKKLNGFIDEEPFIDFASSRNRALHYAETHFPNATFFLMIDANWYIQNVPKLIEFCQSQKQENFQGYNISLHCSGVTFASTRLLRKSAGLRFQGAVHEIIERLGEKTLPEDIFFEVSADEKHLAKSAARYPKDAEILLNDYEKNPLNPKTLFYLGQTYECMRDIKKAYKYYLKRLALSKMCPEETNAVVLYRLGYLCENLSLIEDDYTWQMALDYYYRAFTVRPTRIEPLVAIAAYYIEKFPHISFLYLNYAFEVPYPSNDIIYVKKYTYDFTRYELLSACAWPIRKYEIGKKATQMALNIQPNNSVLKHRLNMYQKALDRENEVQIPPQSLPNIPTNSLSV